MTYLRFAALVTAILLAWPPAASTDPRAPLADVLASAAHVRLEALELAERLRDRRTDMAALLEGLSLLQARTHELQQTMAVIAIDEMSLVPADREALQRALVAGDALVSLLQSKTALLHDPATATRARRLIRAKAQGIARRAEVIEAQVSRVFGY